MRKELLKIIKDLIHEEISELHEKKYNDMFELYHKVKSKILSINDQQNEIKKRMIQMESMVAAHAQGVQNVYNEVIYIKELLKKLDEHEGKVKYIEEFLSDKPMSNLINILNKFNSSFTRDLLELTEKFKDVKKLLNAMNSKE